MTSRPTDYYFVDLIRDQDRECQSRINLMQKILSDPNQPMNPSIQYLLNREQGPGLPVEIPYTPTTPMGQQVSNHYKTTLASYAAILKMFRATFLSQ